MLIALFNRVFQAPINVMVRLDEVVLPARTF